MKKTGNEPQEYCLLMGDANKRESEERSRLVHELKSSGIPLGRGKKLKILGKMAYTVKINPDQAEEIRKKYSEEVQIIQSHKFETYLQERG
jgi:hypothetical protein